MKDELEGRLIGLFLIAGAAYIKAFTSWNALTANAGTPATSGGLPIPSFLGGPNLVMATPDGVSGLALLRALVANDIPGLPASKINSGILGRAQGGLGVDATTILANLGYFGPASGGAGNATFRAMVNADLPTELRAFANSLVSTGIMVRSGVGTYAYRSITSPAGDINVTNGDGTSGNIQLGLPATLFNKILTTGVLNYTNSPAVMNIMQTAAGTTKTLRMYSQNGNMAFYFTDNASSNDGITWTKDDDTLVSSVLQWKSNGGVPNLFGGWENIGANHTWTLSNAVRSFRWNGSNGIQLKTTGSQQTAWASVQRKSAAIGEVLNFSAQWPLPFEAVPLAPTFGTVASSGVDLASMTFTSVDVSGCRGQITVNANADVFWVGKLFVGSA